MSKKYHLGANGPSICRATKNCPLGGEHFDSESKADKAFSEKMGGSVAPSISKDSSDSAGRLRTKDEQMKAVHEGAKGILKSTRKALDAIEEAKRLLRIQNRTVKVSDRDLKVLAFHADDLGIEIIQDKPKMKIPGASRKHEMTLKGDIDNLNKLQEIMSKHRK